MVLKTIAGKTEARFAKVEQVFKDNFLNGWEPEGAALAVYHKGQLVVDLYGGYQDAASRKVWDESTRIVIFSVTKAVASLVIAMLVDQKKLKCDQKLVDFWPDFGQEGKEQITVDMVMHHQAGLCLFKELITLDIAMDPKEMAKVIERQRPMWEPGTKTGYHAISFGWLVDQIVRHVDDLGRGVGDYFRDEVAKPHKIDFFMGLPPEEQHTVARLSFPSTSFMLKELFYDPRILIALTCMNLGGMISVKNQANNIEFISKVKGVNSFNNPDVHRLEQPAALGITKAKDLARVFALMLEGKLLSKDIVNRFDEPQLIQHDVVLKVPTAKGHGFMYERHPYKEGKYLYGHPGYGGSTMMIDPEDEVVIVYLTNGMKTGGGELTYPYRQLRNQILECIGQNVRSKKV
ncbi:unnamed protein product [Bursaphelenchus okinawaensis]|uniref:Beta-lactamase-related domain-containing protein n=1 Tax=Bursaphelenchus okinawaensis TaxID=465554 RepID=A0A811L3F3_9BILA|nr:unnamed protein product [Bursaphelenchus okinawaensis]CAG9116740.1 unnamed protein product [Bursaphelenchus okinawaensis]